jgi:hypothetical protein
MNNWKNYAGSVLLAGLLLQGCSDTPTDEAPSVAVNTNAKSSAMTANALSDLLDNQASDDSITDAKLAFASGASADSTAAADKVKAAIDALVVSGDLTQEEADALKASDLNELYMTAFFDKYTSTRGTSPAPQRIFGIGTALKDAASKVTDKLKDGIVDALDSSVGDKITGAAFDIVLNSEGVTVFMLDLARKSQTTTDVMINALDENWDLTAKMCPMLKENTEFGEKFLALADERDNLGRFFFEKIDGRMYGCLTDAMILSADEDVHDSSVNHSSNGYMGILLEKYATDYFIEPGTGSNPSNYKNASRSQFAELMFTTGDLVEVTVDGNVTGHGDIDGNELANEQFFYAMFRTPTTTDAFVTSMESVKAADAANVAMFMDEIFMGVQSTTALGTSQDTKQGYYNIIAIGSGMYEGIFGGTDAVKPEGFGFGSYTNAFIGFAGLIPGDRYLAYGQAFISAGYYYAEINGVNVWESVTNIASTTAQDIWNSYTAQTVATPTASGAPARSGGAGIVSTNWIDDSIDLFVNGWSNFSFTSIFDAFVDPDASTLAEMNAQAMIAYETVLDGDLAADGTCQYETSVQTTLGFGGDTVCGFHGLIQLAMQEDMVNSGAYTEAEAALFILPPFADLTWDFAYNAAAEGVSNYWTNVVDAEWLANISDMDMMREYLYPSEDGIVAAYVPNWMLSIDWLKLPVTMTTTDYDKIDLNFDAGYVDVYFVSTRDDLATIIEFDGVVTLVDSSIVGEDADGNVTSLYVYTLRAVSPEQTAAAIAAIKAAGENLIGLNTDNAAQTTTAP